MERVWCHQEFIHPLHSLLNAQVCVIEHNVMCNYSQETKEPLPAAEVTQIWDSLREHGVLVGKGGLYGTVSRTTCL